MLLSWFLVNCCKTLDKHSIRCFLLFVHKNKEFFVLYENACSVYALDAPSLNTYENPQDIFY